MLNKAKTNGCEQEFSFLGRISDEYSKLKDATFENKQRGKREFKEVEMSGRIQLDMLPIVKMGWKLRSYTLNAVSAHFLGEQKEDVHHSQISTLWRQDESGRARLCSYCLKDAALPERLMDKLCIVPQYAEMARVCGIPMSFLITKGQQIKVMGQLLRKTRVEGYFVPYIPVNPSDEKYSGAIVIDPKRGFYSNPLATLDFSSLYPSIMIAHNLCYTTLVSQEYAETSLGKEDYTLTPAGFYFVKSHVRCGLLPTILKGLLATRGAAKREMGAAKKMAAEFEQKGDAEGVDAWSFKEKIWDGRQLALKISANSVYGFTGATVGKLPCIPISSSVTAFGRQMIELTQNIVEGEFKRDKYPQMEKDAVVIYGDTDSVMINFYVKTVKEAMDLGKIGASIVNQHFLKPINLAFEKVYYPYLLINKKRYIGGYWEDPDKMKFVDAKGVESVRRDNCRMVSKAVTEVSSILMDQKDPKAAVEYVQNLVSNLLQGKVDLADLVITKSYSRKAEDYKAKQAHVELVKRIQNRTPDLAPQIGDRIPYVIVPSTKNAKAFEKVEDPVYVLANEMPVDTRYYIDNQLKKPMVRIFLPIIGPKFDERDKKAQEMAEKQTASILFEGTHARTIIRLTPMAMGIGRFCVKLDSCRVCGILLSEGKSICGDCAQSGRAIDYMARKCTEMIDLEERKQELWGTCQRCQGSDKMVLCTNRDCPIFYARTLVKNKCERERKNFGNLSW